MRFSFMLLGTLLVASFVVATVAAGVLGLITEAGWWALIAVACPVTVGLSAYFYGD